MDPEIPFEPLNKTASFDHTNWFTVREAGVVAPSPQGAAARSRFCQTYWYPIYFYIRRLGHSPEDAQDRTQEFFARLFQKNYLQAADREKGKFRSFLLVMLKRFLADEWDRAHRQKRGGGREAVSLDAQDTEFRYRSEPAEELTPEKAFERRWAATLMEQVLNHLSEECAATGRGEIFQELKPVLTGECDIPRADVARKLQMTPTNLKVTVHRLRQRCRELLRVEIARTGATPEEVEREIRDLFAALG